jgi:RNA polymerase sigma factor (TIGR02999 family)
MSTDDPPPPSSEVTHLLRAVEGGDRAALGRLFEVLYAELKRLARARLRQVSADRFDTTSLVHDSFMRLSERGQLHLDDRAAFFRYVGRVMRNVLIDCVREERAQKRGGAVSIVSFHTGVEGLVLNDDKLLAVDAALSTLARIAPELHDLVDMRYFAGLSLGEIAQLRGESERTLARKWSKARAFLLKLMDEGPPPDAEP